MATLLKQHGRYYLQFYAAARTPAKKRVALQTNQRRTADALRRKLEHDYALGKYDPWCDDAFGYDQHEPPSQVVVLTIGQAAGAFLGDLKVHGRQPTTVRTYTTLLGTFVRELGAELAASEVTPDHARRYVWAATIAPATRYTRYRHLKAFFSFLSRMGVLAPSPMNAVTPPPNTERLPRTMNERDLEAVCAFVEADYARKRATGQCREGEYVWRVPLFRFAFYTGLRASELARLRWRDVDLSKRTLALLRQKNGKEQVVPVGARAVSVLETIDRRMSDAYVFAAPGRHERDRSVQAFVWNVSAAFRAARQAAGIKRPICFHSLRHGFCTALAEAGQSAAIIQRAARHADVHTTMRYVNLVDEAVRAGLDSTFVPAS